MVEQFVNVLSYKRRKIEMSIIYFISLTHNLVLYASPNFHIVKLSLHKQVRIEKFFLTSLLVEKMEFQLLNKEICQGESHLTLL